MTTALEQKVVGPCNFIDVLEEAVTTGLRTDIQLKDGAAFTDHVTDVVTQNHQEYAVFRVHGRFPVSAIASATRAVPEPRIS